MKKAVITEIDSNTWQFTEKFLGENVYCYLLTGEEKALLIDTAYGFTDIAGAIRELTSLPLTVVNTHGHFDHVTGNYRFGKTFLHKKDETLYRQHTERSTLEELLKIAVGGGAAAKIAILVLRPQLKKMLKHDAPETEPLPECGYFELGGRRVDIVETPGHTQGSISLLDRKTGWLFSGDTCGDVGMLLNLPEATSVKTFRGTIGVLRDMVAKGMITRNYPSHQTSPAPLEKLAVYEQLLERMEKGELTAEEWKNGGAEQNGVKIMFSAHRVKEEMA